jgi:hypothetical protein
VPARRARRHDASERGADPDGQCGHQHSHNPIHQPAQAKELVLGEPTLQREHLLQELDRRRDGFGIDFERRGGLAAPGGPTQHFLANLCTEERLELLGPGSDRRKTRAAGGAGSTARTLAATTTIEFIEGDGGW